jgi:hypothetical protein
MAGCLINRSVGEPKGPAKAKPPPSHRQAIYMRPASEGIAKHARIELVFISYSPRVLFVFSWFSPRIHLPHSRQPCGVSTANLRDLDRFGLPVIQMESRFPRRVAR